MSQNEEQEFTPEELEQLMSSDFIKFALNEAVDINIVHHRLNHILDMETRELMFLQGLGEENQYIEDKNVIENTKAKIDELQDVLGFEDVKSLIDYIIKAQAKFSEKAEKISNKLMKKDMPENENKRVKIMRPLSEMVGRLEALAEVFDLLQMMGIDFNVEEAESDYQLNTDNKE